MVSKTFSTLAFLSAVTDVSAFWRMECRGRTGLARIDPIMDLGKLSPHIHTVHGSSGFNLAATYDDLTGGNCTSCAVSQDKSAYWTPALYFQDTSTNEFEIVPQVGGMLAYYLLRGDNVTAFPAGFKMVAGSNYRRSYTVGDPKSPDPPQSNWAALKQTSQDDLEQRALGFNCLDYSKTPEASLYRHYLPEKTYLDGNCPDGLRLELMFPSCWNGQATATDHKSHVAYPSLVGNGDCPDTHPQRLVTLFYETIWDTNAKQFQGRQGQFVVSNGDPTGFGYHGDFMTGWNPNFLQEAINTCTNDSGDIRDCPLFVNPTPIQSEAQQNTCEFDMPLSLLSEDGSALDLKNLPGNVAIQSGPQSATPGAANPIESAISAATSWLGGVFGGSSTTTSSVAPITSSIATTSSTSSLSLPTGGAFIESAATSSSAVFNALGVPAAETSSSVVSSSAPPAPTSAPVVTSQPGVSYEIVSTQTVTNAGLVEEIVWMEPVVYVTEDSVTTVTVASESVISARKVRERHLYRHQHHARRS
ncbi:uncharacterized protein GGS22DRAFT_75418 [Annulohypoxylon maeteangense]|uniref:uncharacterized protein n=1 Tax=Annulohypoxylon maeteangense TaxID=1927788 RepID=UPI002007A9F0|nr:uncharacterized protein GGS22DRAFT_75418 [Annulohypoxylon maeteangense]KAI0881081.1 hypothetical protein GGS22DRAFT_75418 [Annulohypoxylon maeteangense]